jgi:hypothetical protein
MMVIALTAFIGLALVTCFVVLFVCQAARGGSLDHEALLPLREEGSRAAVRVSARSYPETH